MGNNGSKFTPEQVEQQINLLAQTQKSWSDPSSNERLIAELYQVYTEDDVIVENAWQRLTEKVKITDSRSVTGDALLQRRSRMDVLPARPERPQRMNVKAMEKRPPNKIIRLLEICAAILVVVALVAGATILLNSAHQKQTPGSSPKGSNVPATAVPTAGATSPSNVLFSDPLTENIHNLLVDDQHFFKDGAYHILDKSNPGVGMVIPQTFNSRSLAYQITMEEVAGDETTAFNTFGIMLNYSTNSIKVGRFYTFEILNEGTSSQYAFYKYDGSRSDPWTQIGKSIKAGNEFHGGHGRKATNTVKVVENAGSFVFYVNGQQVGTASDSSLKPGSMGLIVNQKGTEVAFSNMLVTRP